jgi:hypothetical protein
MMVGSPVRVRIGVLSVILFAVLSNGLALHRTLLHRGDSAQWTGSQDEMNRYEVRFRLLRRELPTKGIVGYLAEPRPPDRIRDYRIHFYLTQYALAPLVVVDSTAPVLVVGNFQSSVPKLDAVDPTLILVRDFGDGVLLFRHQPR